MNRLWLSGKVGVWVRLDGVGFWYDWGTNQDGPGGAQTPLFRGLPINTLRKVIG